jgi:hypothetical protein
MSTATACPQAKDERNLFNSRSDAHRGMILYRCADVFERILGRLLIFEIISDPKATFASRKRR